MQFALLRRGEGFVWFHGREPFGPPLDTIAAAVQFLRDLCELYNYTLDVKFPRADAEQT
jgi:hypothetical protein